MFKSNKRRILSIFIMVLALIVLVPSFALSYFYFNTPSIKDDATIGNGSANNGIDDIKENYTGGKDDSSKEYTIYFFPSTLYAQIGYEYEKNISPTKPEDVFGYVEYTYNEESGRGSLDKPTDLITNDAKYNMNDESGDLGYFNYVSNSTFNNNNNLYNNKDSYVHALNYNTNPSTIKEYWASWVIFQTDVGSKTYYDYNPDTVIPVGENQGDLEEAKKVYSDKWESYVHKHYRFRNDRLGYWPNLEYKSGRYLPIKIEVTDYLPSYVYDDMNLVPFTDMGDSSPISETWYNFAFAGWGYFNSSDEYTVKNLTSISGTNEPNYIKDSFTAADLDTSTFDIMSDLSSYADENGVIRLYPIFSNGKNYATQHSSEPDYESAKDGGRDALRLEFKHNGTSGDINTHDEEQYFLYEGVFGEESNGSTPPPVSIASIKNLELNLSDINRLNVSCGAIGRRGSGDWTGEWYDFLTLVKNNNFYYQELTNYGEGVYNFYIFLLEPSLYSNGIDFDSYLNGETLYNYISNSIKNNKIPILTNKEIVFLTNVPVSVSSNNYGESKALFAIEKVTESKFIDNLNIAENISTQTTENYRNSLSMLKFDEKVSFASNLSTNGIRFGEDRNQKPVITDILTDQLNIVTDNLKIISKDDIVILRNVDFTNYSSILEAAFQIRLFEKYQENIKFIDTDESELKLEENSFVTDLEAMVFNDSGEQPSFNDVFIDASYYFDLVEKNHTININGQSYTPNERIYIPRNSVYLGKYDFLLYHDRVNDTYKLYAYRHSNIHIYIFTENQRDTDGDGYVDMNESQKLWERRTTIGSYAEHTDLGTPGAALGISSNDEISFHGMINKYLASMDTSKAYYVRDHVTGMDLFEIKHDGSVWEITKSVYNFRIRKSYIFYITDEVNTNN